MANGLPERCCEYAGGLQEKASEAMNPLAIFIFGFLSGGSVMAFVFTVCLWDIKRSLRRIIDREIEEARDRVVEEQRKQFVETVRSWRDEQ